MDSLEQRRMKDHLHQIHWGDESWTCPVDHISLYEFWVLAFHGPNSSAPYAQQLWLCMMRATDMRCATQCLAAPRNHSAQKVSNFDTNAFSITEFMPTVKEVKTFNVSPLTDAEHEKL